MAIAVASFSSFGSIDSADTSITITKPTGLAVNDLMVAVLGSGLADGFNQASGWTQLINVSASTTVSISLQYKVATSADVSAPDFTFTVPNPAIKTGGIYRITGAGADTIVTQNTARANSATTPFDITGITPTWADSLLIVLLAHNKDSGTPVSFSGYTLATSSPTWTEQMDLNNGTVFAFATASGTRPEVTATGLASVTPANLTATSDLIGAIVSISPGINDNDTPSAVQVNVRVSDVHQPIKVSANVPAPTSANPAPLWVNANKNAPGTVTNLNKS